MKRDYLILLNRKTERKMEEKEKKISIKTIKKWFSKEEILDTILVGICGLSILIMVFAMPVAYLTHYEKEVYKNTEFPKDVKIMEIKTIDDLYNHSYEALSFEIDVDQLKPTGFYREVFTFSYPASGVGGASKYRLSRRGTVVVSNPGPPAYTFSKLITLFYRKNAIYGQYYCLTLEDGHNVLILLNDTAMDIPRKGKVQIPSAMWQWMDLEITNDYEPEDVEYELIGEFELTRKSDNELYYLNASTWWTNVNPELKAACDKRIELCVKMFIFGLIGLFGVPPVLILFDKIVNRKKKEKS